MNNIEYIEKEYNEIFNEIKENVNDFDCLIIATRILEIAKERLSNDLYDEDIKKEYDEFEKIVNILKKYIEQYI